MNTIDHQLLIDRRSGAVTFEGDRFPSTGTYRSTCAGVTRTMHRQFEGDLANLGDDPPFSYDAPVAGVQPGG